MNSGSSYKINPDLNIYKMTDQICIDNKYKKWCNTFSEPNQIRLIYFKTSAEIEKEKQKEIIKQLKLNIVRQIKEKVKEQNKQRRRKLEIAKDKMIMDKQIHLDEAKQRRKDHKERFLKMYPKP